jgi:tRNA-2-methylthio-N6-dimethylallyladenosine synthase
MEGIVLECENLAQHGTKEITLLGQIVNNYGKNEIKIVDGKTPFVQLLERIDRINGVERIRYMSPHPSGFHDDLILAHSCLKKLCPTVHLPVQSGSDRILRAMRRPYTRARVHSIVNELRKNVPNISITTDVIVGYPGETDEDFQETVAMFREIKFNMAFIFKYSPRNGTFSATLPDSVSGQEKDHRNKILLNIVQGDSIEYNKMMMGEVVEVLVDGRAKRGENKLCGHTRNGHKVIFDGFDTSIGKFCHIKITGYATTVLYGELVGM